MSCPLCGCPVPVPEEAHVVVECLCCETLWMVSEEELERILVGAEG